MRYDEVILIRRAPDAAGADAVLSHLDAQPGRCRLLFFHGPGLAWAVSATGRQALAGLAGSVTLMLCAAGWRRRQDAAPPEGWHLGSLIRFWDAADGAERVACFGSLDG